MNLLCNANGNACVQKTDVNATCLDYKRHTQNKFDIAKIKKSACLKNTPTKRGYHFKQVRSQR